MTRVWKRRGLSELRRNTQWFIEDSPSTIRLVPHKKVDRPGGTHAFVPQKARRPQTFRLIPQGQNSSDGIESVEGADISKWTYHLVGEHNCEFEIGDTWVWRGIQYRIIALLPENNWERRAFVTIFGKAPPENVPPWIPRRFDQNQIDLNSEVTRSDQILGPRSRRPEESESVETQEVSP